ncbi:hypothetical protein CsSME_00006163 [Camellia sinensis var. sinensis]
MALRIVYGLVFLSVSCACFKVLHLVLRPVFYLTSGSPPPLQLRVSGGFHSSMAVFRLSLPLFSGNFSGKNQTSSSTHGDVNGDVVMFDWYSELGFCCFLN